MNLCINRIQNPNLVEGYNHESLSRFQLLTATTQPLPPEAQPTNTVKIILIVIVVVLFALKFGLAIAYCTQVHAPPAPAPAPAPAPRGLRTRILERLPRESYSVGEG